MFMVCGKKSKKTRGEFFMEEKKVCGQKTEVFSRVVGYFRPVHNWNEGKKEEFSERKTFKENKIKDLGGEKMVGPGCGCGCDGCGE